MKTLKQLRQDNGVTQEELARRIQGIRGGKAFQGPVSAIESNRNSPTVSRLVDTLAALGFGLTLCAVREGEMVPIDVESLLGTASRAKDAGDLVLTEETTSLPTTPELPQELPVNLMTEQNPLESLILGILKK